MAYGDIAAAYTDELEFNTTNDKENCLIRIPGTDVFIICYNGDAGSDGIVDTFDCSNAGALPAARIDTLTFASAPGLPTGPYPCICPVPGGTHYVVSYKDDDAHGRICTIDIANNGQIAAAVTDAWEFDEGIVDGPHIFHVQDNWFVITYYDDVADALVAKTVYIAADGTITKSFQDTLTIQGSMGVNTPRSRGLHINGDICAVVFLGNDADGWVATFDCDSSGNLGSVLDTLEIETGIFSQIGPLFKVATGIYGAIWVGVDIKTFDINESTGAIGSIIGSATFSSYGTNHPDICRVGSGQMFAFVSNTFGPGSGTYLSTVEIDTNGNIGSLHDYLYVKQTGAADFNQVAERDSDGSTNWFVVVAEGAAGDGYAWSVEIEATAPAPPVGGAEGKTAAMAAKMIAGRMI